MSKISNIILVCIFVHSVTSYASSAYSHKEANVYNQEPFFSNSKINLDKIRVKVAKNIKQIALSSNGNIDIEVHVGKQRNFSKSKSYKTKWL